MTKMQTLKKKYFLKTSSNSCNRFFLYPFSLIIEFFKAIKLIKEINMNIPENNCSDNCNAKLVCLFDVCYM